MGHVLKNFLQARYSKFKEAKQVSWDHFHYTKFNCYTYVTKLFL